MPYEAPSSQLALLEGTDEGAFAAGAAPITLIDGDRFTDLLIEYCIGVHKRTLEVLAVDPGAFADLEGMRDWTVDLTTRSSASVIRKRSK